VNGDDPEAVSLVSRLAYQYRKEFKKDVVIDMITYRRRGHNEADDPSLTQPLMYQVIDQKRSVRKLYTESLIGRGDITVEEAESALIDYQNQLERVLAETKSDLKIKNRGRFCSQSCNATFNNKKRGCKTHEIKGCLNCGEKIKNKFCNKECYHFFINEEIRNKIEENSEIFHEGTIKKFLIKKYGEKCMDCGWGKIHPITGKVPIQLEHIDGNFENNKLENLKLLCPNCNSLTLTFGALNKGNGRPKERNRNKKK
jgi:RNAse (barnase) inhibitor barstar